MYEDADDNITFIRNDNHSLQCEICDSLLNRLDNTLICNCCGTVSQVSLDELNRIFEEKEIKPKLTVDQRKALYKEIESFNRNTEILGISSIPDIIITKVIDRFGNIPITSKTSKKKETRNKKRRQYIAAYIHDECRKMGLMRTKREIQKLCGLGDRNITTTISNIKMAELDDNSNLSIDSRESFTLNICMRYSIPEKYHTDIYKDVEYITDVVMDKVLITSNFDAKMLGSVYIAIKIRGFMINIVSLCKTSALYIETINTFIDTIVDNKAVFTLINDRFSNLSNDDKKEILNNRSYQL